MRGEGIRMSAASYQRKLSFLLIVLALFFCTIQHASAKLDESADKWQNTLSVARGQTVFFYAWGGSKPINDYLRWASRQILTEYGVRLKHVKVADISEAVSRLKAEDGKKSAIDLVWINGENFAFLKQHQLLLGNLWEYIPNTRLLATDVLPLDADFGVKMDGFEVPWGVGQFNFIVSKAMASATSVTAESLLNLAKTHPQQLSYPRPPEFHGSTFLKQLLVELSNQDERLFKPATNKSKAELLPKFWAYLDKLHPFLWQQGEAFPSSSSEQMLLFQQRQLLLTVSFNPNQLHRDIAANAIPADSSLMYFEQGSITNSHNLAIPKGAPSKEGAKIVINFLLSERAQKRKLEGEWGDPSVISELQNTDSSLPSQQELHSSWQQVIEDAWQQRYGA